MRLTFRKVVIAVAFIVALGVADQAACPNAEASYGFNDALGTIGISAGIGAVMGLSTIAFYDSPTKHLSNMLMGAGAGLVVGLGVAAYLVATGPQDDEINPEELLPPGNKPDGSGKYPGKAPGGTGKSQGTQGRLNAPTRPLPLAVKVLTSVPATFAMRDTSDWTVAIQVLELRF